MLHDVGVSAGVTSTAVIALGISELAFAAALLIAWHRRWPSASMAINDQLAFFIARQVQIVHEANLYDTGGMRRTHLRGHTNILKRLLIHAGGFNLGLLIRAIVGVGTPRGLQDVASRACAALVWAILCVWEQRRAEGKDRTMEQQRRVSAIQQKLDKLDEAFLYSEAIDVTRSTAGKPTSCARS